MKLPNEFLEINFIINDLPCSIRISTNLAREPRILMALAVEEALQCMVEVGVEIESYSVEKSFKIEVSS